MNPFVVADSYAKDFIAAIRDFFQRHHVEVSIDRFGADADFEILQDGRVLVAYTTFRHHEAGFHRIGQLGCVDFAAFGDWDEPEARRAFVDVFKGIDDPYRDTAVKLWNAVFFPPKTDFSHTLYDHVQDVVQPLFRKIQKYW